ncbi:MAG TPA: sulfatase-like hydrolase/transferase, partial [Chitinophagaceae bacterium]|nr:sulfatase-like hydrolase/transferase [Chitinophagaceae bacterium]
IIADDLGTDYLGCYSTWTDTARMPNLRALLSRGIRFTRVWSAPVCSPARAGILTGRYPFRTGVGAVISSAASPQLDTSETSIAQLLKTYSVPTYQTANTGKWHLHNQAPAKWLYPNKMGYDFYSGNFNGQINNYYSYQRIRNGVLDTVNQYATTQTVNDAVDWLDTISTTRPFFLWLAFNAPHSPFHVPPASLCDTTGLSGTTADISMYPEKYFKAAIEAMDTECGRLFQYLNTRGLLDSTNIIFIGDNGNETQVAQIPNPNKSKATLYDYGVHVPMILAGPAVVNPGRVSNALVNTPDLFATLAELGGLSNWKSLIPGGVQVDSRSLLPIIQNTGASVRDWIFTEQFNTPAIAADGKTIRDTQYHLIRFDNGTEAFYDLINDSLEDVNLLSTSLNTIQKQHYQNLCDSMNILLSLPPCYPLALSSALSESQFRYGCRGHELWVEVPGQLKSFVLMNLQGAVCLKSNQTRTDVSRMASGVYAIWGSNQEGQCFSGRIHIE